MREVILFFKMILDILKVFKDSDGDGRPDVLDSDPNDPEVQ